MLASSNNRGGDALANLEGMNLALQAASATTPRSQGRVLAHSSEYIPKSEPTQTKTPKEMLQPANLTVFQRWQTILKIVVGKGTGAPKQIGVILVSLYFASYVFKSSLK